MTPAKLRVDVEFGAMVLSLARVMLPLHELLLRLTNAAPPQPLPFSTRGLSPGSVLLPLIKSVPPVLTVTGVFVLPSAAELAAHKLPLLIVTELVNVLFPFRLTSPAPSLINPPPPIPPLEMLAKIVRSGEKLWPELVMLYVPLKI